MIAVDTNILVYAHRADSEWHQPALRHLTGLAEGNSRWAVPWPCVHEFLAIVTHPRIYQPATPPALAINSMRVWLESPLCTAIGEGTSYLDRLQKLVVDGAVVGGMVHDARIAAICIHHAVTLLWTADRDLSRFGEIKTFNPCAVGRSQP